MKYITLLLLFYSSVMAAQSYAWCPSDSLYKAELRKNPKLRLEAEKFEEAWEKDQVSKMLQYALPQTSGIIAFAYNPPYNYNVDKNKIYTIPVVFHIIHPGNNPGQSFHRTDEEIKKLLKYVNEVYAGVYPEVHGPRQGGVFAPIQFALAKRDENNNPTTGILHIDGSSLSGYTQYGLRMRGNNGVAESQIQQLSKWNPNRYLNIYVVNKISGSSGTLAYAYVGGHGTVFMLSDEALEGHDTLPHELGHTLNLSHTFNGGDFDNCPPDNNCLKDNDKICDTEAIQTLFWRRPTSSQINPCTHKHYDGGQYNIMNYLNGESKRFTEGQVDRMVLELKHNTIKQNLLKSKTYLPPQELPEVVQACVPPGTKRPDNKTNMGPANITFGDLKYKSEGYNIDGDKYYIDHTKESPTQFIAGKAYPFDVSVATNPQRVHVFIDYNNNGHFNDPGESVFMADIDADKSFSQTNPDYTITIPGDAVKNTPLRMRVVADFKYAQTYDPKCAQHEYGQTEDFAIMVLNTAPNEEELSKVGINTETPETILEVKSTKNGVIFPKMTNTEMWNIKSPATGMLIYNVSEHCLAMNYGTENQALWRCLKTRDIN